ncbi:hypothetical protein BJ684DRAFT_20870 [Piptocephalis cylindrospora]|uniref:Uncharacterized protein n=1 Tax=Piptocephalis cylindrospora TaxID=1907219 RepID=A0A4P9Y439_9FUNG|nr:hypothetical protein BJ684DRAFT_20870 [Piptocephalis cylindrospora]|eukprot:RKP12600.1 hypothetical protein BJ684DRAFT_20870 [Piptocephalis cylindrospora]
MPYRLTPATGLLHLESCPGDCKGGDPAPRRMNDKTPMSPVMHDGVVYRVTSDVDIEQT